uniref:HTH marR-type domain-containing protein n=1 Tax=uncultured Armatimonadetes bacterium TaxID=157466 RepID=A0A6J4JZA9_9BACT|nr:hypothetical protein AVDCRST_MAG63-4368 [uncultured Armatimonadetes bacterium]
MVEAPPQQQESEARCHPEILEERARHAEQTLPEIARRLFTLDPADPLADLPNAQLKVCSLLLNGERTMSQVGEELNISVSAVTQIADRLEKADLVARHAAERDGDGDRRSRYLTLTARGAALMEARRKWRVERVASALGRLSDADQARVVAALDVLLSACRQSGDGDRAA